MKAQSTISGIVSDVITEFKALLADQLDDDVEVFGPKDDEANSAPPCIWWEPTDEQWTPPQRHGMAGMPSSLWTREITIDFMLFGGDVRTTAEQAEADAAPTTDSDSTNNTEVLIEALVNAWHRRSSNFAYQVAGGRWATPVRTEMGLSYILTVTLRLPLVRLDNQAVKVTSIKVSSVAITEDVG